MSVTNKDHYFLEGGGEMGSRIREKDWSKTPLGDAVNWPQSLRTMVAVMLNNPFGMYIAWGKEYIQLYNDGYRPILGSTKHPQALGISTKETFSEIWDIIGAMFDRVMEGNPVGFPDFMLPLNRNGFVEECFFDFSYSPIKKEDGEVGGVLVTVIETTSKKKAEDNLKDSEEKFRTMAENIPNLAWMAKADGWIYWYNKKWYDYTGTTPEQMEGWGWQSVHDPLELPHVLEKWQESIDTGQPFELVFPLKGADGKFRQFLTRVLPVRNSEGKIYHWFGSNTDITAQKEAEEALKQSNQLFHDTVKQAPVGISILRGKEFIVEMANDTYLRLAGRKEQEFIGRPLFDSLPEVQEAVHSLLKNVFETGVPYHGNEVPIPVNRYGKPEIFYFDFLYYPLKELNGDISGIIVTATEVTEKVEARKKTEQNEERLNIVVEASELGTWELNVQTKEVNYSKRYLEIIGGYKNDIELTHEQLLQHLHADDMDIREKAFKEAITSGHLHYEARVIWFDQSVHWMEGKGKVFYDADNQPEKLIGTIRDTTEEKQHQQVLEESEKRFRDLVMQSPVPKAILRGKDMVIDMANVALLKHIWQKEEADVQGKKIFDVFPELQQQKYAELLYEVYTTGKVHSESESLIFFNNRKGMHQLYIDFEYAPLREANASISGIKITVIDVTEKVEARKKIEESEKRFRSLTESIPQLIWETDEKGNALFASGKWMEYTGKQATGEAQWRATIHPDDFEENAKVWSHSLATGQVYKCDVRLRNKEGVYRWHSVIGAPVFDKDNKITKWVGAFTDIHTEKAFTHELEMQVQDRTKELAQTNLELEKMNTELQSFAYISSHDLQEPLRKIQTFSSQIMEKEARHLSENGKDKFQRMQNAAKRMQTLIEDLLAYSRTTSAERILEKTDLHKIIEEVKEDLKEELQQKQAIVEAGETSEVNIIPFQFRQLLFNLVSNSVKFSDKNRAPHIAIKSEIKKGINLHNEKLAKDVNYCHITVSDNGIGFEQQYSEKIFDVFQRLHGKDKYHGTGIGLAIVKKIVENHNGVITATGEINKGSTFDIYIPAE